MDYRTKKKNKITGQKAHADRDPYSVLLGKLSGLSSRPPRQRSADQHWSKEYYEELVREEFESQWAASDRPKNDKAAFRAQVTREIFRAQTQEIQDFHTQAAKDEHENDVVEWKKKLGGPPSTDPQARQSYVSKLYSSTIMKLNLHDSQRHREYRRLCVSAVRGDRRSMRRSS